jgi:hypothetical protein
LRLEKNESMGYDGFATTYKNLGVDFDCYIMKAIDLAYY